MLKNKFYHVVSSEEQSGSSFKTILQINKEHEIFKGHFPSTPVVPGVCMMQMIKELIEEKVNKKLQLTNAANIKFLSVINPIDNSTIDVEIKFSITVDSVKADAVISVNNTPYFKFIKAVYK